MDVDWTAALAEDAKDAIAVAEGQRRGILAQREREGLTGPEPYSGLNFKRPADRRLIASVYASMVPRNRD